jgi:hypothetical protein
MAIITSLAGIATADLQTFAKVLSSLPHGTRVPLEYYTFSERHRRKSSILQVDRQWYGTPLLWTRDDALGVWHHQALQQQQGVPPLLKDAAAGVPAAAATAVAAAAAAAVGDNGEQQEQQQPGEAPTPAAAEQQPAAAGTAAGSSEASVHPIVLAARAKMQLPPQHTVTTADTGAAAAAAAAAAVAAVAGGRDSSPADGSGGLRDDVEESLKSCLVLVDVDIPLVALSDGVHSRSFAGNGLVVYHGDNLGLVLVSCLDACRVLLASCSCNVGSTKVMRVTLMHAAMCCWEHSCHTATHYHCSGHISPPSPPPLFTPPSPQVDRNTVTIGTCDINLSFGAHPAEMQGIVRFLHHHPLPSLNP